MFIVLPVGMNYQTERRPTVTFTLMGVNILVYLVSLGFMLNEGKDAGTWIFEHLWLIPAASTWYTYLTSMFVHAGFFHLLGNMMYLFLFGCCVEDLIGRWRFLALYLLSGFIAELAYITGTGDHFASIIPMGGASGAISGCMGAYLLLRAGADIDFKYFGMIFLRPFAGDFSLPAWVVISFWFLKDVFFAALDYSFSRGRGGVAFGAHVGGFLAGVGLVALIKLLPKKEPEAEAAPLRVHLPTRTPAATPTAIETPTLYLYNGEAQTGPFDLFQIQRMLSQGTVPPEAVYWSEGMTEWRSVSELAEGVVS
jgi:membrane associated rhomboid family serine protease